MQQEGGEEPPNCISMGYFEDHQIPTATFEKELDEYQRLMNYHLYLMEGWAEAMENLRANCCCPTTTPIIPLAPMCPGVPYFMRYSGVTVPKGPTFGGNADANKIAKGEIYPWNGIMTVNGIRCDYQLCMPRPPAEPDDDETTKKTPKDPLCPPVNVLNPCPAPWDYPEPIGPALKDPNVAGDDSED